MWGLTVLDTYCQQGATRIFPSSALDNAISFPLVRIDNHNMLHCFCSTIVCGGNQLTATDIAVALQKMEFGDPQDIKSCESLC